MRTDLRDHPKIVRMAAGLNADRLRVIGGLWSVWSTFDTHSPNGLLEGYTLSSIDEGIGWQGFGAAMQAVGWLIESESGLSMPDYEEHNGTSAKRRAQDTKLKKSNRNADKSANGSWISDGQMSAPEAGQMSASQPDSMSASKADKSRTRVRLDKEKRRLSSTTTPAQARVAISIPELTADGLTPDTAAEWLAYRKRKHCELGPRAWQGIKAEAAKAGITPQEAVCKAMSRGWQGFEAEWLKREGSVNGHAGHKPEPKAGVSLDELQRRLGIDPRSFDG